MVTKIWDFSKFKAILEQLQIFWRTGKLKNECNNSNSKHVLMDWNSFRKTVYLIPIE